MWGVWAPGASVPCGGGAGAPPFAGPGLIARVGPVRRCQRVLGGLVWCSPVLGGGGGPPSSMGPPRRGVVVGGGGGAAGGGGACSGGVGVAGMALGFLVGILVPPVGVGGRASCVGLCCFVGWGGGSAGRA